MLSCNSKSNGPTNLSAQQPGFLSALYRDIVLEIFSYLSQQDCLTCMSVCRDWYATVPQYAQNTWKEIQLDRRDASIDHQRQQQCLGSHVKRVSITSTSDKEDLSSITLMQRLLDWKCTRIQSLEFSSADIPDQRSFFDLLKQLAPRLTHLKLDSNKSNTAILAVLYACPELTCFDYRQRGLNTWGWTIDKDSRNDQKLDALSLGIPANFCTKITYLRLDTLMTREDVEHILKKCSQLQCYVGPIIADQGCTGEARDYITIDSIFSLCPKINSLAILTNPSIVLISPGDFISKLPGLRYFDISTVIKSDEIAACLTKSQSTLECLILPSNHHSDDWSPILRSLWMPNLRFLSYANVETSISSILVSFLSHCPNLQEVVLRCLCSFDLDLVRSLRTMQSLRSLEIEDVYFTFGEAFAIFLERLPALETLIISEASLPRELPKHFQSPKKLKTLRIGTTVWAPLENQELDKYEATAHFLRQLIKHTKLETVRFGTMRDVNLAVYQELTKIPMLKDLIIPFGYYSDDLDDTIPLCDLYESNDAYEMEFSRFIHMLRMSSIEKLWLIDCYDLSAAMLDALAELPLKELSTCMVLDNERCTNVEIQGLLRLLCKSQTLVDIFFDSVSGIDYEQLNRLLQSQAYADNVTHTRVGYWRAYDLGTSIYYSEYGIQWKNT